MKIPSEWNICNGAIWWHSKAIVCTGLGSVRGLRGGLGNLKKVFVDLVSFLCCSLLDDDQKSKLRKDYLVTFYPSFSLLTWVIALSLVLYLCTLAGTMLYFSWLLLYLSISLIIVLVSGRGMFGITLEGVKKDLYYLDLVSLLSSLLFTKEAWHIFEIKWEQGTSIKQQAATIDNKYGEYSYLRWIIRR